MPTVSFHVTCRRAAIVGLGAAFLSGLVEAQTVLPAKNNPAEKPDAPVTLSPFVVNTDGDDGWLAGNSMLANRTNQALKDSPVTIEALTKEFLLDVGAFDDLAAGQWVANVAVTFENENVGVGSPTQTPPNADSNRVSVRGIANEGGASRNLFKWLVPSDSYNVERIDFGRGSNSLLFGESEPGGNANIYTKRAIVGRSFGEGLLQVGSFNSYRASLDYNRSLSEKLALRVNVTRNYGERDFDFNFFLFEGIHGALTYRPFKDTQVRVEGEAGRYTRSWGSNREVALERATPGRGFNSRFTILTDNTLVDSLTLPTVDRNGPPAGATVSFLETDPGGFPRPYNWMGENDADRKFTTASIYVEQRVGLVNLELGLNQQIQGFDERQSVGNYIMRTDAAGRRFIDFFYRDRFQGNKLQTIRGMATYKWEPVRWMSQFLVASAELRTDDFTTRAIGEKNERAAGSLAGGTVQFWYRVYVDEPGAYSPVNLRRHETAPETTDFKRILFVQSGRRQMEWARAYTLSTNGKYWDGRLHTQLGARLDNATGMTNQPWVNANTGPRGEQIYQESYDESPERFTPFSARNHVNNWSKNVGAVYRVSPNVNLYSVFSTSFRQANSTAVNFANEPVGQQIGETFEVGVKSDFLRKKLSWNFNWYDLTFNNLNFTYTLNGITQEQLEDLFNPSTRTVGQPGFIDVVGNGESRKQFSKGFESTLIFYPGAGWNVRLAGAHKKVTQDKSMLRFKELLADAIARGGENPAYIAAAQSMIALSGADGRELASRSSTPLSFNFAVNYRFHRTSPLSGLSAGCSGSYQGDFVLGYINNAPIRGGKLFGANANASYRTKVGQLPTTFRLNLANLLETDYLTQSVVQVRDGSPRHVHIYGQPRSFMLTASTQF
jgi:outer membrane receptor protein involved in Fe transport